MNDIRPKSGRPVILVFLRHYLPAYKSGGPIQSISNLVEALSDEFLFKIVTSDRDFGDKAPFADVKLDTWNQVGKAQVIYLTSSRRTLFHIARLIRSTPHDLIYLNSVFAPDFAIKPLIIRRLRRRSACPCIIAPRGEFSSGALALKRWKKSPFLMAAGIIGLHKGLIWQASADEERHDIESAIGKYRGFGMDTLESAEKPVTLTVQPVTVTVAPDLTSVASFSPKELSKVPRRDAPLKVCFLSRITRKKNLDYLLDTIAQVSGPVQLSICGPKEDLQYWAECERQIRKLPANICATYLGPIPRQDVFRTMESHDIFFLPTRGENFGHVFLESWASGLPVLTSDQTPWRALESAGVGWDLPLDEPKRFVQVLSEVSGWSAAQWMLCRQRCRAFVDRYERDSGAVEKNREMFKVALAKSL